MAKKLTELVDVEVGKDLDGIALFEATVKYEPLSSERGGIAMSSGCVSCNNGGGCVSYVSRLYKCLNMNGGPGGI